MVRPRAPRSFRQERCTVDQPAGHPYSVGVFTQNHSRHDLTARARIRDAALTSFAEQGFAETTMRSIAQDAGVSLALVQHHFGSKDGLRAACDDHVIDVLAERLLRLDDEGRLADPDVLTDLIREAPLLLRYLARAAVDDSAAASTVFDQLANGAEAFLTSRWPERFPAGSVATRDTAAVMTAMHSGTAIMLSQIVRRLDAGSAEELLEGRLGLATMNLYSAVGEFVDSSTGRDMRSSLDAPHDQHSTDGSTDGTRD